MIYRQATIQDATGVAEVFLSWRNIKTLEEAVKTFEIELREGGRFIVAVDDQKIVGLTTTLVHGRPKLGLAELDHIAVLPKYQHQGIANQLMTEATLDLQQYYQENGFKLRKLYLLTREANTSAHHFYEKIGFKKEAVLKDHFYTGHNEVVYSKFFEQ